MQAFIGIKYSGLGRPLEAIDRNAGRNLRDHEWNDLGCGRVAGRGAVINRGVGTSTGADPLSLEG